jgi:hypothetical protein
MKPSEPIMFIVPINMRSFSPEWDLRPEYQFLLERYLLRGLPFYCDFLFEKGSMSSFYRTPIYYKGEVIGKLGDFETLEHRSDEMRLGYIYHYMQPLDVSHRRIRDLVRIYDYVQQCRSAVVFYITPLDFELANSLNDPYISKVMQHNINIVSEQLRLAGATVIDLSGSLDSSCFNHGNRPYGHLTEKGRRFVASALANYIEDMAP